MKAIKRSPIKRLTRNQRQAASVSQENLVDISPLFEDKPLPWLIRAKVEGLELAGWARSHRDLIEEQLHRRGGLLLRGFQVDGLDGFEAFLKAATGRDTLLEYTYRSTPRTQVKGNLMTSTEYPSEQWIPMHNEESYAREWPMKIGFFCVKAAQQGGETPIADSRAIFDAIESDIRERFREKKVLYVRNYGPNIDLPWQEVFQTESRQEVESFCRAAGIDLEWGRDDRLTTRQICQSVAQHPATGQPVWFNQAHLFHVSSLPEPVRDLLLSEYGEDRLPRNAYYGDGSPIERESLQAIREAYRRHSVLFPWQEGDVMLLDNMLAAHGRAPFSGKRRIVVGMAEACSLQN